MPGGNVFGEDGSDSCLACNGHGCGICRARMKFQEDGRLVKRPAGWTCAACGGCGDSYGCSFCRDPTLQEAEKAYEATRRMQLLWELSTARERRELQRQWAESQAEEVRAEAVRRARVQAIEDFLKENGFSEVNVAGVIVTAGCCGRKRRHFTYPLHVAAEFADDEMVVLLLQDGANPLARNTAGKTALEAARGKDLGGSHTATVQILEDALAAPTEKEPQVEDSLGVTAGPEVAIAPKIIHL